MRIARSVGYHGGSDSLFQHGTDTERGVTRIALAPSARALATKASISGAAAEGGLRGRIISRWRAPQAGKVEQAQAAQLGTVKAFSASAFFFFLMMHSIIQSKLILLSDLL